MGQSVFPAPSAASKTRKVETLTSGTSWTVPAGVTYVNATLVGGGGGGGTGQNSLGAQNQPGNGGQIITTLVSTTPGASITYAIGAGGTGPTANSTAGGTGGNTTFVGATTAAGGTGGTGNGSARNAATDGQSATNGGATNYRNDGGAGGAGQIILEYWV